MFIRIQPCSDSATELSGCSIQWYRLAAEGGKKDLISSMYAKGGCTFLSPYCGKHLIIQGGSILIFQLN
ncbi:unnamed protein product [Camellia sinensis]